MYPKLQLPVKGADHRVTKTERRILLMDACMTPSIQTLHWDLILKSHAHHDKLQGTDSILLFNRFENYSQESYYQAESSDVCQFLLKLN